MRAKISSTEQFKLYKILNMIKSIAFLFAFITVAKGEILQATSPVISAQPILARAAEEYDPHPQYNFGYEVQDTLSGDSKSQVEARDGDVVRGQYSLIDPDGFRRTVDYTADPINGFNADVRRKPLGYAATVKTVAVPTVVKTAPTLVRNPTLLASTLPALHAPPAIVRSAQLALPATQIAAPAFLGPQFATAAAGSVLIKTAPYAGLAAPATYSHNSAGLYQASLGATGSFVKTTYASPYASYAW